jgi:hypothetical protein
MGIRIDINGSIHEGFFKDGKAHGRGRYISHNKHEIYTGDWDSDHKQGYGELICTKTGMRYIGEFFFNRYHGQGKEIYPDGSTFSGHYIDGKRSTKDPSTYHNVEHGYVLEVRNFDDKKQPIGKVVCRFNSGSIYEGEWKNGMMNGPDGVLRNSNGTIYRGGFLDGKYHGEGIMVYPDGVKYEGNWAFGK